MSDHRLYGLPGAETLYTSVADLIESKVIEPNETIDAVQVEEWDTHPPEGHLPFADAILSIIEDHLEDAEIDDRCFDHWHDAAADPDVLAAAEALRTVWASRVKYRMARNLLDTHTLTWDADGNELLDGERVYVPSIGDI